jgi:aminoglycoside 6-adenylyltransferase
MKPMRSEQEMLELIVNTAKDDDRIRAVILNGSRAALHVPHDIFQDFDAVYVVTDVASFKNDPNWIDRFGPRMMLQRPDDMEDPPPGGGDTFAYLMQFVDGNRIDLTLCPLNRIDDVRKQSMSVLLLDKDGLIGPLPPANEKDYLHKPPTAKAFVDCCNEFWWVCPYVAKGLWRQEIIYAKYFLDHTVRDQLMKMIIWYVGMKVEFSQSAGKVGRHLEHYLEPELWALLLRTYSDADYDRTWTALETMCDLFKRTGVLVAGHFGYDYPQLDDERVRAHLRHVRLLPQNAPEMY